MVWSNWRLGERRLFARAVERMDVATSLRWLVEEDSKISPNEQQRLLLHNHFDSQKELWIEPWGDSIILSPNATYLLIGDGPPGGSLEFDLQADGFAVYGWSRSILTIFDEERNIVWHNPIPVP